MGQVSVGFLSTVGSVDNFLDELVADACLRPKRIVNGMGCEPHHLLDMVSVEDRLTAIFALKDDHDSIYKWIQRQCSLQMQLFHLCLIRHILCLVEWCFFSSKHGKPCLEFDGRIAECLLVVPYPLRMWLPGQLICQLSLPLFVHLVDIAVVSDFRQLRQHLIFRCGLLLLKEEVELLDLVHLWKVFAKHKEDNKGVKCKDGHQNFQIVLRVDNDQPEGN